MKASVKFLSVLLIVAMCFSLMAASASATGVVVTPGGAESGSVVVVSPEESPQPTPTPVPSAKPADDGGVVIVEGEESDEPQRATVFGAPKAPVTDSEYKETTVAVIGEHEYDTLNGAVDAAAGTGSTVKLVKDLEKTVPLVINGAMKLDLNGHTLSFTPKQDQGAAISVTSGKVTISNGDIVVNSAEAKADGKTVTYQFAKGVSAAEGASVLLNVNLNYKNAGGKMLDGGVTVYGGSYNMDPAGFVGPEYVAEKDDFGNYVISNKPEEPVIESVAEVGGVNYETIAAAIAAAGDGATVTLLGDVTEDVTVDKNLVLNLGGRKLTGALALNAGKSLTLKNGELAGAVSDSGALTLESVKLGDIAVEDGASLTAADANAAAGNITAKGANAVIAISNGSFGELKGGDFVPAEGSNKVTGGSFAKGESENFATAYLAEGYEAKLVDGRFVVSKKEAPPATAKVTSPDGKTEYGADSNAYVEFFKGEAESGSNKDLVFLLDQPLKSLSVGGKTLTNGSDYNYDAEKNTITIAKSAAFLKTLPAGRNMLVFSFENGAEVQAKLYVYPSIVFTANDRDYNYYIQGSGSGLSAVVSDAPKGISICNSGKGEDHAKNLIDSANYSVDGGKVTVKSAYLDSISSGATKIGFWYDEALMVYDLSVLPAPSISPADSNKDGKWYYGDSTMVYTLSPNIVSVSVDGTKLGSDNYTAGDKGILTLKSAFLKSLKYGEHTLSVETRDGSVSTKFSTNPSLVAKNGNTHTLGGKKDLAFVASDPVSKVWIGSKELDTKNYTLSSDKKTVTLKADFLNTLKADTSYVITVQVEAGTPTATFKILSASSAASNPKTGDSSGAALWAGVLVLSGAAVVALLPRKRKQ